MKACIELNEIERAKHTAVENEGFVIFFPRKKSHDHTNRSRAGAYFSVSRYEVVLLIYTYMYTCIYIYIYMYISLLRLEETYREE